MAFFDPWLVTIAVGKHALRTDSYNAIIVKEHPLLSKEACKQVTKLLRILMRRKRHQGACLSLCAEPGQAVLSLGLLDGVCTCERTPKHILSYLDILATGC